MNEPWKFRTFGALALVCVALWIVGCKVKPPLGSGEAQALLQAQYDRRPAEGVLIVVDRIGLRQGLAANYWKLTKVYPNQRWADYTLTEEGKKVLKLHDGGEVIQWRPDASGNYQVQVVTLVTNRLRATDVAEPETDSIPGTAASKTTAFNESLVLDGVPEALQDIARNPGNRLSSRRHASFVLVDGNWTVQNIT